jgi:hypothetical protein
LLTIGALEAKTIWTDFPSQLTRHGPSGVAFVVRFTTKQVVSMRSVETVREILHGKGITDV